MPLNKKMLVHALDKSKARIILAFLFAGHAMDTAEVMDWTGLSKPTADAGLRELKSMGLLGSQALAHNRTVWLPAGDMLDFQMQKTFTSTPQIEKTFISGSSSRGSNVNQLTDDSLLLQPGSQLSKSFISGNVIDAEENPPAPELLKALDAARIREPKRSVLARLPHVTVELIEGHVATAPNKGLAIYRIEHDWDVPVQTLSEVKPSFDICEACHSHPCMCSEHDIECGCVKCRRAWSVCKYIVSERGRFYPCETRCADGLEFCTEHGGQDWERPEDE